MQGISQSTTTLALPLGSAAAAIFGLAGLFVWALRRRWFSRFHNGFAVALMLALGGAGLATAVAIGLWGYEAARRIVVHQLLDGMSNVADVVESQVERDVRLTAGRLDRLAASDLARVAVADPERARDRLAELEQFNHRLLQITVADREGRMILRTSRTDLIEPADPAAMGYLLAAGKPFISAPYHSRAFGRSVLCMASPVKDPAGRTLGAITLRYDLQAATAGLVGRLAFGRTGRAILVDGDGRIIAHPDRTRIGHQAADFPAFPDLHAAQRGWVVGSNTYGQPTLFLFRKVRTPTTELPPGPAGTPGAPDPSATPGGNRDKPMLLLTDVAVAEAMAPVHELAVEFLCGVGAIVIFWVLCARLAAGQLTRPLTHLLELLAKVRDNDLTVRSDLAGRDELGRFAGAFNDMVQGLSERDRIKQIFGRYVTTQVSERILKGDVHLGGRSRNVTMLFSDVRNFTAMAEGMPPARVVEFLNDYFSEMVDAVFEHGGVLDKFIGDGMLATFGSVDDAPDPCGRAVRTALRMKAKLADLNARRRADGKPPIHIGIGIHTEDVIVGNIGSRKRSEYTVIGDGVNTCSRVEAMNKNFGTTVLITQSTWEQVRDRFACRPMPETKLRGKSRPLQLFEVVAEKSEERPDRRPEHRPGRPAQPAAA